MKKKDEALAKDTTELLRELGLCDDFQSFYRENRDEMTKKSLSEMLDELCKKHNIKKSSAIRGSEISEVYAYQIFSGIRKPDRKKLIALGLGMKLALEEFQLLLKCAGYPTLYAKIPFDSAIIYAFIKKLTVEETNKLLFSYDLEMLG